MSIFALVSQSLRTGEPMHQVLPQSLLDRLFYHDRVTMSAPHANDQDAIDVKDLKSLDYMFFATGLVGVYQLLQVISYMSPVWKHRH
jgi:hypothetical protein